MMKVDVVLPAAGTSERMNLQVAKQFVKVLGKHLLAYTVDGFHKLPWVRHIVIVVSPDQTKFTEELMKSYGFSRVKVCAGSHTRHRSIWCGLEALKSECSDSDVVIVHDAARPFVSEQVARQVAEAAFLHGAAGVTRSLVSTVIRGDVGGRLVESLDRRCYRNSEMPQAFHYRVIASAYEKCSEDDLDHGTECLLLAMKYSQCRAALVEGNDDLWKVTYQKDIYSMESVVKEKLMVVSVISNRSQEFLALDELRSGLSQRHIKVAPQVDCPANTFVVDWDGWQRDQSLEGTANQICRLYKQDMPSSAVKLDLMVVVVFLKEKHSLHKQVRDLSSKNFHDHRRSGDGKVSASDLCVDVPSSNLGTVGGETELSCGDYSRRSSETGRSSDATRDSSNQFHYEPTVSTPVSHSNISSPTSSDHHGDSSGHHGDSSGHHGDSSGHHGNSISSSVENYNLPESQKCGSSSADVTSQSGFCGGDNFVESVTPLGLPTGSSNSCRRQGEGQLNNCTAVVRKVKAELERGVGGKFVLVVGVLCGGGYMIGERLAELIWQRSSYVDGQVLTFDDRST